MSRYLLVDVGAGTMDVLYYDDSSDLHYKAVARSPVRSLAEKARSLRGSLLVAGGEMGGGPVTEALADRAKEARVVATSSAARTLHHDPDRVRSWGIEIVGDGETSPFLEDPDFSVLTLTDLEPERLRSLVEGLGVPFEVDVIGVCAQDHGMPPPGVSHLDYRHKLFQARLDEAPYPHALLYRAQEVPPAFNRLACMARSAGELPAREVYVMDSGMAAILGASLDPAARDKERVLVLDVATSHTVGAALRGDELLGFFEYHTRDVTLERLESLLRDLARGNLEHERILEEGGHGAYLRGSFGFENVEAVVAAGPRRGLVKGSSLPVVFGAPWGDNMMTGTVGLLEAVRRRCGLPSLTVV